MNLNQQGSSTEASATFTPGVVPNSTVNISLPKTPKDDIYQIRVTAEMRDTFGNTGKAEYIVWSHYLPIETKEEIDGLLSTVADLAGVSSQNLLLASKSTDPATIEEPLFRRARMVRLYALNAARDKRITIGELESLIRGAKHLGQH